MARMADRILARGIMGKRDERFGSALRSCERIIVDDVSEYLYARTDQEVWNWAEDFPNLAPPFPVFWMEAISPKATRSVLYPGELRPVPPAARIETVGVLVQGHRRPAGANVGTFVGAAARGLPDIREMIREGRMRQEHIHRLLHAEVEWAVLLALFVEHRKGKIIVPGTRMIFLDRMGALVDAKNADGTYQSIWSHLHPALAAHPGSREPMPSAVGLLDALLVPFALALSLMHCKNVELVRKPQNPKLARAYRRRHQEPLLTYHVLDIEPMKRVLRDEGDSECSGLRHALHICRGHFKDYRQRGLFGKHKGLFWWESHLRGSADVGTVIKDYRVRSGDS